MVTITYESAKEALEQVAAERPDHIQPECLNFTIDGEVCCFAATALNRMVPDFTFDVASRFTVKYGSTINRTLHELRRASYLWYTEDAADLLSLAQQHADRKVPWGTAVRMAVSEYDRLRRART